jgi:hypothetical protein
MIIYIFVIAKPVYMYLGLMNLTCWAKIIAATTNIFPDSWNSVT